MTNAERIALRGAARDLHDRFRGVFGEETIAELLFSSYQDLAATATVPNWLALGAERFARQRLEALADSGNLPAGRAPAVLFVGAGNAGRSQMALAWFSQLAGSRAVAWSAGTSPTVSVDPVTPSCPGDS
jgi:arsenate reductase (thioredoxin)